jgi:DNA mismatch endonuclease, patch repair protein
MAQVLADAEWLGVVLSGRSVATTARGPIGRIDRAGRPDMSSATVSASMDVVSPAKRSAMMSGIRGKDTKPELAVRRLVHSLGYRFRLHRRDLPGSPDLVLPRLRKVIFVHGCFWHRHPGCRFAYTPKANAEFWLKKLTSNASRDAAACSALIAHGWDVMVVWECQVRNRQVLAGRLCAFLTDLSLPSTDLSSFNSTD